MTSGGVIGRRLAGIAAAFVAAAAILTAAAPGALAQAAHASLVTSYPLDGAVLARQPDKVTVGFDQPVGVSADSLEVFTPGGQRADVGGAAHAGSDGVQAALRSGLGKGTYTAAWHVVSADSHPVQGAFTFSIGAPSATRVPVLLPAGSHAVSATYAVTRWLEYVFFAILGGAVTFLIVCWPAGARRRGIPALVTTGWAGLVTASLLALLLQGVYAAGAGFGQLLDPSLELTTLHSRLGTALQARQGLTIAAAVMATLTVRRLPALGRHGRAAAAVAWTMLITAIAATWAAADHASTGLQVPLAIGADVVHLVAMAVWAGGLMTLAGFALRGPATAAVAAAVPRFSAIALCCVSALAASGAYEAWRLTGSWGALFGTTYGVLVIAKIAGMGILICLGYLARRFVHQRLLRPAAQAVTVPAFASAGAVGAAVTGTQASVIGGAGVIGAHGGGGGGTRADGYAPGTGSDGQPGTADATPGLPSMRALRGSVTAELAVVAVVLAATALLVNTPTGRESYAPPVSATSRFDTGGPGGAGTLNASVTPARLGPDQVDLTLTTPAGQPFRAAQVQASLYLGARDLGPLPVALTAAGPGRYRAASAAFGFTGQWQLRVTVRSDAFDETTVIIGVTIH
jgi:copper transport protein